MQALQIDWTPLRAELKRWHRKQLTLPVWWRDDDATAPSAALDHLIRLSEEVNIPVHLAVIPRDATPALAATLKGNDQMIPVVHGWAHANHEPEGENRCEFGLGAPLAQRQEQAAEGLRRLRGLMGATVAPMFVPPWNRVADDVLPHLPSLGFQSISGAHPNAQAAEIPDLAQINTHVDPLYWRPSRRLSEPQLLVDRCVRLLKRRRQGKTPNEPPFGLLTHHLVHDDRVWEFCRQFWLEMSEAPISRFRHPVS
ncbi:polysaccharide deacetylase family protein [Cognatishimia sp. SS12]|uniref:polysaccharide deacetylase family protein n=1 Tax=Cognatishimia sp. SS12 TaxID=2979465 RepID=UPI00232FBEBF|nr:polysaccharide deacetylase family protein [Cognatishimia sp. SS12]MDC0738457.1 polysaccharide deacetylase family protein [Cognatishimia sp. SS12]